MAEVIGLAASLIQIAGAGVQLSTSLYNFVGSASRADSDIADIADDVQLTANTLDSVGKVFEREGGTCVVSRKAIQDAESLIKRCEAVFAEIQQMIEKKRKTGKDGRKLSTVGKFSWPMKEQRVELLKKRLESLKTSLQLLLQVLLLANGQAKGDMEKQTLDKERERIRELHQRQQESLKALQALEQKLSQVSLSDDETLHGSSAPSRVPTIDLMMNTSNSEPRLFPHRPHPASPRRPATSTTFTDDSETSESDGTLTDDEIEHISAQELTQCAAHVQKLLKRIHALQHTLEHATSNHTYPRQRVHRLYRRFCRKFESEMIASNSGTASSSAPLPDFVPPSRPVNDAAPRMLGHESTIDPLYSTRPAKVQSDEVQRPMQLEHSQRPQHYGDHGRPQLPGLKAQSDAPSRESSKDSFQNANAEEDDRNLQGSGDVHRTKTGRISKAKKGLKVHSCECGKSYTRAEHLRRHQKNHTSDDVVQCDLCGRTFYRRDLLERHMGRHKERLTSQHGDTTQAGPSSTPASFNYTHTFQPTTSYGVRLSSTSSEASTPWILPPPSSLTSRGQAQVSGQKIELPRLIPSDHGARHHYLSHEQAARGPQYTLEPAPKSGSYPISPGIASTQKQHTSFGSPQQPTQTSTSIPSEHSPFGDRQHSRPDAGLGHSARHSVSSYGYGSPVKSDTAQGHEQGFKPHHSTDAMGQNSTQGDLSLVSPTKRTATESEHDSPLNMLRGDAISPKAGPDANTHHSGFTPVNSMRREWHDPNQQEPTNYRIQSGRKGPLSSDQRALASQMRSITACTNCKQLKQKCDTEVPCGNCRKHALRSGYLPEPNCRGQTLTDLPRHYQGGTPPLPDKEKIGERKDGVDGLPRDGGSAVKPAPPLADKSVPSTPKDEVLQRLVEEAGSDKQLESSRADRKAFFENHWAQPPWEGNMSMKRKPGPPGFSPLELFQLNEDGQAGRQNQEVASQHSEHDEHASPPPEPADKTSEEWISWKRARLSEGTRKAAKRKREQEESTANAPMTSPTKQQYGISPTQAAAMATAAAAGPSGSYTETSSNAHHRKRSKAEHVTNGPDNDRKRDGPMNTGNLGQRDVIMGEGEENEKDIVDQLLEQWTIPV